MGCKPEAGDTKLGFAPKPTKKPHVDYTMWGSSWKMCWASRQCIKRGLADSVDWNSGALAPMRGWECIDLFQWMSWIHAEAPLALAVRTGGVNKIMDWFVLFVLFVLQELHLNLPAWLWLCPQVALPWGLGLGLNECGCFKK